MAFALINRDIEEQPQHDKKSQRRRNAAGRLRGTLDNEKGWDGQPVSPEEQERLDSAAKKLVKIPINELRKPQRSAETRLQLESLIQDLEAARKLHEHRTVSGNAGD